MAEKSKRIGSFMSESMPIKRSKFYRVQFVGLCLGWLAIQNIFETNTHKLLMAFLFATAVCAYNAWSDMRRAEAAEQTASETRR